MCVTLHVLHIGCTNTKRTVVRCYSPGVGVGVVVVGVVTDTVVMVGEGVGMGIHGSGTRVTAIERNGTYILLHTHSWHCGRSTNSTNVHIQY